MSLTVFKRGDLIVDAAALTVVGLVGWIGVLARNYYTEMAKIAIERSKDERKNEQERVAREREQFDIVFQNLLTRVNEERDVIQALINELREVLRQGNELDRQIIGEIDHLRREREANRSTIVWDGSERRDARKPY
jgi:hypothetical protein